MNAEKIAQIVRKTNKDAEIFAPLFFRLNLQQDSSLFAKLVDDNPDLKIYDTLLSQLSEFIKSSNPSREFTKDQLAEAVAAHLQGVPLQEYGVWVYYPWSQKVVHILDKDEFVQMRTNRNKYKITDEEEIALSTKIVGVVGLSVGQSVSLTMAIERTFGELRIADFDELEITNLNRLRSGVYNMGLKKTIIVAREIAEIDPYLKVTLFSEGLTAGNMEEYFTAGGKLDLIIDECDGLDIKILLRQKARELGVPVVMEASDRGTLDVERFDLEPDRPLLHGYIDHLDHTKIGSLTNEEKIPYILPMLGVETISKRLKASMVEIKQTVSTWPQLASAVALGGALCADVVRRILLDQYRGSGRYFVDIEELIGDAKTEMEGVYDAKPMEYPELTLEEMMAQAGEAAGKMNEPQCYLSAEEYKLIVEAALLAPSAGNNQPWKWLQKDGRLFLFHDRKQSYSWTDKEDFIAQISLGAAIENAVLKAEDIGAGADTVLFPLGNKSSLVAVLQFHKLQQPVDADLAKYMGQRCTNRKQGDRKPIQQSAFQYLNSLVNTIPGAQLTILTDETQIAEVGNIEPAAERMRFLHPQSHSEFFLKELKWNESGKEEILEGLDIKTLEMSLSDETGIKVASDPGVIALLNRWRVGKVFEKAARNGILSSSAVGLVTMPTYSPENYIIGGRACEKLWLGATKLNLAIHPMSAPLFLYSSVTYGDTTGLENDMLIEINQLYSKLCILFPELKHRHGVFLCRLFNSDGPTARSLRKPVDELYNVA